MHAIAKILPLALIFTLLLSVCAFAYIGNSRTGKFHQDTCRWVYKMNESNKVYFESRSAAVQSGYVPCKVCRP